MDVLIKRTNVTPCALVSGIGGEIEQLNIVVQSSECGESTETAVGSLMLRMRKFTDKCYMMLGSRKGPTSELRGGKVREFELDLDLCTTHNQ